MNRKKTWIWLLVFAVSLVWSVDAGGVSAYSSLIYSELKLGINGLLLANVAALGWAIYTGGKTGLTLRSVLVGVALASLAGGAIGSMLFAHDEAGSELLWNSVLTGGVISCVLTLGSSIVWALVSAAQKRPSDDA